MRSELVQCAAPNDTGADYPGPRKSGPNSVRKQAVPAAAPLHDRGEIYVPGGHLPQDG
jgi:hypothetical protein